jgi:hypothetical protein
MTDQAGAPNRRNIWLTVIVLIGLIALGMLVGYLSVKWGAHTIQPMPENSTTGAAVAVINTIINAGALL